MAPHHLLISEIFYSIQGEGPTTGNPSVFIRTGGCNLNCSGFSASDTTGQHIGCDSRHQWQNGRSMTNLEIIHYLDQNGWLNALGDRAHLIITGGEPMLQQSALYSLINDLEPIVGPQLYTEVETNGTQEIQPALFSRINQFNVSPKLAFSGEPATKRKNITALRQLVQHPGCRFKFVIHAPSDIEEMRTEFLLPFKIPASRVYLMPEGTDVAQLTTTSLWLVEVCKQYRFNFSARLQILIWGDRPGV